MTYKLQPGKEVDVSIDVIFGREQAEAVIRASLEDYLDEFGG
jgi:inorganic pyrophosphatase